MPKIDKLKSGKLFIVMFGLISASAFTQNITGKVIDAENKKPLSGVLVRIENSGIWTLTSSNGDFNIKVNKGETLEFRRAGLLEEKRTFEYVPDNSITVLMEIASTRIKEISLTAKKKKYSEIEIKEEALKSIQAFSLNEVLEQIPGQKLQNLNFKIFF